MTDQNNYDALRRHSAEANALVKDCLKTALLDLIRERPYRDLTVAELCRRAGVSRMAFYRNYQVVNDLFREAATDLNQEILRAVGSPFRAGTSNRWYEQAFRIIARHREQAQVMFREDIQFDWMRIVNGLAIHDPDFPAEKKYQRLIWCGGFENVVAWWLNHEMDPSPEEMAEYCVRYLPHIPREDG